MKRRTLTIALQTLGYPPDRHAGGMGTYTQSLATALAERGHTVHVVSRTEAGERIERAGELTIHRIGPKREPPPKAMSFAAAARLAVRSFDRERRFRNRMADVLDALVRDEGVEIIEAGDSGAEAARYRPARHPHVPLLVRLHGPTALLERFDRNVPEAVRRMIRWYEGGFLRTATHLSAPTRFAADVIRREFGFTGRPIDVYPNPPTFDIRSIEPGGDIDPDEILFVGRLTQVKGVDVLASAIPAIRAARPNTRVTFVGPDLSTGTGHASTKEYVLSLVPPEHHHALNFTGFLQPEELPHYYRRAAVCVFPSVFEMFGYTCLEAMTYGKAIVTSANGGMADLLAGGDAGLVTKNGDHAELATAILRILGDPGLRERLGDAARERALERYSMDVVIDQIEANYRRAIEDRAPRASAPREALL